MTKRKAAAGPLTKIEGGNVSMSRKSWAWFGGEVNKAIGLELHDFEPGKGRTIKMPLEVWLFLLSVVKAGVEYSGYCAASECESCCDDKCEGHGGRDFCFGSACVCVDGDLFECSA